jgi:biopolymer transport protein ExbB
MRAATLLLTLWLGSLGPHAGAAAGGDAGQQITDLDQLLQAVRQEQQQQRQLNQQREARFLREKDRQQSLLEEAKRDFEQRQRENQPLVAVTETNRAEIARLEQALEDVVGDMGDLSSAFREFAGDFAAELQGSMITAQLPGRRDALAALAAADGPATIDEIEQLWLLVQEEMTEAGKIARFEAPVVRVDGTAGVQPVMRIGTFSAFSDGRFLRFVPETGELLVLSRQPSARFRNAVQAFAGSSEPVAPITVDPTRGSLLGMLSYTPSLRERIDQGGVIALIILALGALGLLLTLWRGLYLSYVQLRIRSQLRDVRDLRKGNPLGRVLLAVRGVPFDQEELLQLKLDEAVLAEIPALERGNGVIKLLAATSPLLGLLGTVTGMILTFQAISLFGTGDPKLMAGGISQALVTTVLGLVVAIPLLFGHSLVSAMSRSMVQRLDEQCAGVLARTAEQRVG